MTNAPRSVLFRADASASLGVGHVMRCLALSVELRRRGWRIRFACSAETPKVVAALEADEIHLLHAEALSDPAALIGLEAPDWLVVDHYGLDRAYETALRQWAGRVLVLDDLARPHDCDLLLDQTVGREAGDYAALTNAMILAGPRFALLRPDFAQAKPDPGRKLERVLVAMGGTDPANASALALRALDGLGLPVSVVLGGAAPHLDEVRRLAAALDPPAEVLTDVADMAGLMARCGLAVGAAGSSALERARMALPTVMVVTADNQRLVAKGMEEAGAAVLAPLEPAALARIIKALAADQPRRLAMAKAGLAVCDGRGAARLADLLGLTLRPATLEDGEDLLSWRNEPTTRANSLIKDEVDREGHFKWLAAVLADRDRLLLMAELDGVKVGMARFDLLPDGQWRTSISLSAAARGKGLGRPLLAYGIAALDKRRGAQTLAAEIRTSNAASLKSFLACGFAITETADNIHYLERRPR